VRGLALLGFPLHASGKPSDERAAHLFAIEMPILFLQGTRDALADVGLMQALVRKLGARATLVLLEGADHSWHVPARSGRKDADMMAEALDALTAWAGTLL
jgi:predicted alpha/beta-hydrolase family hydrolase